MKARFAAAALVVLCMIACARREAPSHAEAADGSLAESQTRSAGRRLGSQPAPDRMVVRTASLRLISADTAKTFEALERIAAGQGGYMETSRNWRAEDELHATATLRIPEQRLREALVAIRQTAKRVDHEQLGGNDVSQEFVDLAAHLRNYEATERELRELLATIRQRSQKAAEILEIHRELVTIRGEIERVRGRMNYLQTVTSLATIHIEIVPDSAARSLVREQWQPVGVVKDAVRATVATMQAIGTVAIWFFIFVLPLLLLASALLLLTSRLVRALRKREALG